MEGHAEEDRKDHHAYSKNNVLRVVNGWMQDICPWDGVDIWRTFDSGLDIGECEADEANDEGQQGKCFS